jgi:hypothetical protein
MFAHFCLEAKRPIENMRLQQLKRSQQQRRHLPKEQPKPSKENLM